MTVAEAIGFLYLAFTGFLFVVVLWIARLVGEDRRRHERGRALRHVERAERIAEGLGHRPRVARLSAELDEARRSLEDPDGGESS